ncbi:MAG: transglycosylase SLT domain-containing protein [Bacteroidota bacterium]
MTKLSWILGCIFLALVISWPMHLSWLSEPPPWQLEQYRLVELEDICLKLVQDSSMYTEGWDSLAQPIFWRKTFRQPPDSIVVNIAKTREIVEVIGWREWHGWSDKTKKHYEDSIRTVYKVGKKEKVFFTTGRSHFYRFKEMMRVIDKGVGVFAEERVDPWYAQAILLVESPGKKRFSTEGAYGSFQLMAGVAKDMGLVVNDSIDEREDFAKSAQGAARLIDRICLPKARALCEKYKLRFRENDLWFRLLVMHIYHAGIGNVRRVVKRIKPKEGGQAFITQMWQTTSRRFGNSSQNYSQIILACMMELDAIVQTHGLVCPVDASP